METARGKQRLRVENDMIRKREKEFLHDQMWGQATKYYEHFNKVNSKFEDWTSPRYYSDSLKQYADMKSKREKEELLQKRREMLRKQLDEENKAYEVEVMVMKNKNLHPSKSRYDDVPCEVLEDINDTFKAAEEIKRKHEAETKLYQQWRMNNPIVRNYERSYNNRNMKLSWLDQQIEKRMKREKEEEDAKRILKEREESLKKQKEMEEAQKRETAEKNQMFKTMLDQQVAELKKKQAIADELKKEEHEEFKKKMNLVEIEEKQIQEERRRLERECALFNVRQHKLKLKQKSKDIQENLAMESELILKLEQLEFERIMEDESKRKEVKKNFETFAKLVKVQQELEKERQKHLDFVFDSEAKNMFDRQSELWKSEERARQKLLKEVLATVKCQIEENLERNRQKQKQILKEREENTEKMEMYCKELEKLNQENEKKKARRRNELDEDVRVKNARKVEQESIHLRELDDELDRIRKEEERLKKEIMNIQRKHGAIRPTTSRRFF